MIMTFLPIFFSYYSFILSRDPRAGVDGDKESTTCYSYRELHSYDGMLPARPA